MKTLVLANQKGGVGKSAVASQLARYCASRGVRTLVIDLDHQANTSKSLGKSEMTVLCASSASQLLAGDNIELAEGYPLTVIPADDLLSTLERQPERHNAFLNSLKAFLDGNRTRFDLCIIDTNPNPDIRYAVALITADYLLSPVQLNQEALDGIGGLLNHARYGFRKIKAAINPTLHLIGILPNMVEPTPFQRANLTQLVASYPSLLIALPGDGQRYAFIPKRSAIAEAQAEGSFIADGRKTAAREAWKEIQPVFDAIAESMTLRLDSHGA